MRYAILYSVITITMLTTTPITFAGSASVINVVSVSANSGGNTAGLINEGVSKARVFVKTVINGEVVEEVDETVESSGADGASVEKTFLHESEDGSVKTETNIHLQTSEPAGIDIDAGETSQKVVEQNQEKNTPEVSDKEKTSPFLAFFGKLIKYVVSIFS